MRSRIEPMLYIDPQQEKPACFCSCCGGARYGPSLVCIRCQREGL